MAAKKKTKKRSSKRHKQATRGDQPLIPAWFWLALGLVVGLGLGFYVAFSGWMPKVPEGAQPRPEPAVVDKADDFSQDIATEAPEWKPEYEFYSVLPEMEVVIPVEELQQRTRRSEASATKRGPYLLQVASFQSFADAERTKARLALLGIIAQVQSVNVNGQDWHRVRVGPYDSSRETERIQRQLLDNGFEAIVLSESG